MEAIVEDKPYEAAKKKNMKLGVDVLPRFPRDTTDRNRTSPFAFTGNKFEFRMLGSSNSIASANTMLNAAVAESLKIYADRLENADDFEDALHEMIKKTFRDHRRIIFNGNGYDGSWIEEATKERGLLNYQTTPDCVPHLLDEKNVAMLTAHNIFSESELYSRCEITLSGYCKAVKIEARTMIDMARRQILPAIEKYLCDLAKTANEKQKLIASLPCDYEKRMVATLSGISDLICEQTDALEMALSSLQSAADQKSEAYAIRDNVIPAMDALRFAADNAESWCAEKYWPFPTYGKLLFGVQ
jgi:glutamine synthetase